jgi:hypothetical protein
MKNFYRILDTVAKKEKYRYYGLLNKNIDKKEKMALCSREDKKHHVGNEKRLKISSC